MCFSTPKAPKVPDPKLPQQPIQRQEPAGFQVGRDEADDGAMRIKANRSRRRLRISRDNSGVQVPGFSTNSGPFQGD